MKNLQSLRLLLADKDKEIEKLKELCNKYEEEHKTTFEEWKKTINIINELERHLEQQWLEWKDCETDVRFMANEDKCILEKLRELKGSDKE